MGNKMTTALIAPSTETKLQTSSSLNFYCYVTLSETEQIILNVEETEWKTINNKYTQVPTGEIKKYRLETLIYAGYGDGGRNNKGTGVFLDRIVVRGFRKDGGLKFRDTSLYGQAPIMDKILPQIPDSYHDYARQEFAKEAIKLQEQLTILTNMGVTV
jgi:hypothetical protein